MFNPLNSPPVSGAPVSPPVSGTTGSSPLPLYSKLITYGLYSSSPSIPSAVTIVLSILITMLFSYIFKFSPKETSTMAILLVGYTGFILLFKLCYPFSKLRLLLYITLISIFVFCIIFLRGLFDLVLLKPFMILLFLSLCLLNLAIFTELSYLFDKKISKYETINNKNS